MTLTALYQLRFLLKKHTIRIHAFERTPSPIFYLARFFLFVQTFAAQAFI